MLVLGLTGGIACGKTNISQTLAALGAVIVDGDVLSRELTAPGGAALPAIRGHFGDGVFHGDDTLDRRALGACVFADDSQRAALNGIIQPMIRTLTEQRIGEARKKGASVCVLDMPLLYEMGYEPLCDEVWCAYIPRETQLTRLMARDGFTRKEAEARLRSQLPADEKARRADVVIDTGGAIEETRAIVRELYAARCQQ